MHPVAEAAIIGSRGRRRPAEYGFAAGARPAHRRNVSGEKRVKNVTIYDVAKLSGVSAATVSRVLNNTGYPISQEVKDRVQKAARDLDYAPNLLGKYLKTRSNREIGVIIPNITNYYYPLLLLGVHDVAAQRGYHIILCNSYRDSELEIQNIHLLASKQVMGILTVSLSTNNEYLKRFIDKGGNMVLLENSPDIECNKVTFEGRVRGRAHHEVQPARLRPTV